MDTECENDKNQNIPKTALNRNNIFSSMKKDDLLDLVINLETELEAREIAFNVLKLKYSKKDISLYYGCLEALQCDSFSLKNSETVNRCISTDIKNISDAHKYSMQNIFSAKNKAFLKLKIQLEALQGQHDKVCTELSHERNHWLNYKNEIIKLKEKYEEDGNYLREEFEKVSNEKNQLSDKVQAMTEDLELTRNKCQLQKEGAIYLIRERSWLTCKLSHLLEVINTLEGSLQEKTLEIFQMKEELFKVKNEFESSKISWKRDREESESEFKKILKSKNDEIISLQKDLEKLRNISKERPHIIANSTESLQTGQLLTNGMIAKDFSRVQCDSIYDNVDQLEADRMKNNSHTTPNNCPEAGSSSLWLMREAKFDDFSNRASPFNEAATIKRGSFKPKAPDDFTGFDIFGREMADLQELLVSMASPAKETPTNQPRDGKAEPVHRTEPALRPIDVKTLMLSVQTAISNGNASKLKEILQPHSSNTQLGQCKLPMGILPLHYAVEFCSDECVKVLLEHGFDANAQNEEKVSSMHIASTEGSYQCLKSLLDFGGSVSLTNHIGMTPLHCAANSGHTDCCILLLQSGAKIDALNLNNWTPLHMCTFSGHAHCLKTLLTVRTTDNVKDATYEMIINDIINMADKDGCTLAYLACAKETKDCLEVLSQSCTLDLQRRDKWNRSILDVASPACLSFLFRSESTQEITCSVAVDLGWDSNVIENVKCDSSSKHLNNASPSKSSASSLNPKFDRRSCAIGSLTVAKTTNWAEVEEKLGTAFLNHISEVSIGLRTKKISRSEQESPDTPNPFTMGLTVKSIKYFSIGRYHWSPGIITEKSPFEMLTTHNTSVISIKLFGLDNNCPDSLAYDSLIPIYVLQNYLRLVQQYKSVVFYGPKGMGKSYLVRKLALYIQVQETTSGCVSEVSVTNIYSSFTSKDLVKLLVNKGCLIDSKQLIPPATSPIIIFDGLTQVSVDEVFKEISFSIENRGPSNQFILKNETAKENSYYMHPNCYIICTMDRPRSTGLELSIQQRFKWVQLRCDQEPSKYLLHRHLLRDLADSHQGCIPLPDNSVYKAVEWLICVWQRLNDVTVKLGILDLVFGPCYFLSCPIEKNKPKVILRWLISLWNQVIAPTVSEAVIRSSGSLLSKESDGQQKVASTALYVLMQRAVVSGCPLAGQERDRYLACFHGSNELDIKVKSDKKDPTKLAYLDSPTFKHQFQASPLSGLSALDSPKSPLSSSHSLIRQPTTSHEQTLKTSSSSSFNSPSSSTNKTLSASPLVFKQPIS